MKQGRTTWKGLATVLLAALLAACSEIKTPESTPFFAESKPPAVQELRWSNGPRPKTLDPARATAAPETDIVRALFEGLTDIDPKTLAETPAAAESWTHDGAYRTWTFRLRENARWSNGRPVTASDFVASWRRVFALGDRVPNRALMRNIVGLSEQDADEAEIDFERGEEPAADMQSESDSADAEEQIVETGPATVKRSAGLEAVNEKTLRVHLESPDKDFPKLVANVIFRPIYGEGRVFETAEVPKSLVTNGPFVIGQSAANTFVLKRSDQYWNKQSVGLELVRFVSFDSAEAALTAYKNGEIDAVSNAEFEPLALKLLEPFKDFRRTTHSALNFYEVNTANAPFNDRRVREALSVSIDRERLAAGELEGATQPAASFLPLAKKPSLAIAFDAERGKELLEAAGFPNGENFPRIRLVVNRNDTQQRVARSVARMWKQNLNIETDLRVTNTAEYDAARTALDYDIVRRGVVLPTLNAAASLEAIFGRTARVVSESETVLANPDLGSSGTIPEEEDGDEALSEEPFTEVFTEQDALYEMNAIPLYFPTSYSLVKPYVEGFEINGLDAPLLSAVKINNDWRGE